MDKKTILLGIACGLLFSLLIISITWIFTLAPDPMQENAIHALELDNSTKTSLHAIYVANISLSTPNLDFLETDIRLPYSIVFNKSRCTYKADFDIINVSCNQADEEQKYEVITDEYGELIKAGLEERAEDNNKFNEYGDYELYLMNGCLNERGTPICDYDTSWTCEYHIMSIDSPEGKRTLIVNKQEYYCEAYLSLLKDEEIIITQCTTPTS